MRVLIVDDHDLVRDTLAAFLETTGKFRAETAMSHDEALARVRERGRFDLILLDYAMPGADGLEALRSLTEANGERTVALLSGNAPRSVAHDAIDAGAIGFVPKTIAGRSLVAALSFMLAGETFLPAAFLRETEEEAPGHPLSGVLSGREMQVLGGLMRGLSNKEIARELGLQEVTVKLHVKTLTRKLDARNRTHAAMIGKEAGLA